MTRARHWTVLAVVTLLCAWPAPAAAQFGGLKKKLQKAAGKEASAEAAQELGVIAPPPTFDNVTIEMTGEQLDAVLAAAPKMQAAWDKMQADNEPDAANRRRAEYDAAQQRYETWTNCRNEARRTNGLGNEKLTERLEMLAAQGAVVEIQRIMDSVQKVQPKSEAEAAQRDSVMVAKSCGRAVPKPKSPNERNNLAGQFSAAAGLTEAQWVAMKERLLAALNQAKRRYDEARASGLSEAETEAIRERYEDLKKLVRADWFLAT